MMFSSVTPSGIEGSLSPFAKSLESAQVKCWITERDISAGEDWTEATRNAIASSRLMVLVLSENANAAPHLEREIGACILYQAPHFPRPDNRYSTETRFSLLSRKCSLGRCV
jgi:hypothetical protein